MSGCASAGTGKTQVLTARVFRLLLRGVDPGAILCLTFTKAGAAEMAGRISTAARRLGADRRARTEKGPVRAGRGSSRSARMPMPGCCSPRCWTRPAAGCDPDHPQLLPGAARRLSRWRRGWCPVSGRSRRREESVSWRARRWPRCWSSGSRGRAQADRDDRPAERRLEEGEAENFLRACARAPARDGRNCRTATVLRPFIRSICRPGYRERISSELCATRSITKRSTRLAA
jgi:ATP-dependent helicase/nuclease subunit A